MCGLDYWKESVVLSHFQTRSPHCLRGSLVCALFLFLSLHLFPFSATVSPPPAAAPQDTGSWLPPFFPRAFICTGWSPLSRTGVEGGWSV
jgi:hypothetical protein